MYPCPELHATDTIVTCDVNCFAKKKVIPSQFYFFACDASVIVNRKLNPIVTSGPLSENSKVIKNVNNVGSENASSLDDL